MDRERLLKNRLTERVVTLDGVGDVRVRGMSREEVYEVAKFKGGREDEGEVWLLARTVVDPPLSEADVRAWRAAAGPGEVEAVVQAITELSGMSKRPGEAERTAYARFPEGPGPSSRILDGVPPGDDSRPPAGGDG